MLLTAVVAVAENGVIGKDGGLPWHLPDDLKHFKAMTLGRPVVMGRHTFDSIGKALPGRRNIVVTSRPLDVSGVEAAASLEEALRLVADAPEVAVIGGARLWRDSLPAVGRLYLTRVHANVEGDTVFPDIDPAEWREIERRTQPANERNAYAMSFITLDRR
ncbi:MAG: dihydrofolate reductase [Steroidobacteraceae bacterium]